MSLAVPRTVAAWHAMEGNEVYRLLSLGRSVPPDSIDRALAGLDVALDWVPSGDRYVMRAAAELEHYLRHTATADRGTWLARTARDLEAGLAANPADGRASLALAYVRAWQGAGGRDVVVGLLHSMDTMPSLRMLWPARSTAFLAAWRDLTPDEAAAVRSQLRAIWQNEPDMWTSLVVTARAAGRLDELSAALAGEPTARAELERLRAAPAR